MTNSYSSSPQKRPRLLLLHGLNNNPSAFAPLRDRLRELGWEVHFVTLPCHGENRKEARVFKDAFACFDRTMKALTDGPWAALAFSHGALYLQLWLEKEPARRPAGQVLLAPALYIHHQSKVERIMGLLPSFFVFKSFTPSPFRRYQTLSVWEYRILLHGMRAFQKLPAPFKVPTLILIDPKDELVSVKTLQEKAGGRVQLWPRDYLKKGLGQHHVLFHPDYFEKENWERLIGRISEFLSGARG